VVAQRDCHLQHQLILSTLPSEWQDKRIIGLKKQPVSFSDDNTLVIRRIKRVELNDNI